MARQVIRSIRKGSVQWNEEDRINLAAILFKCGYAVRIENRVVPEHKDKPKPPKEYVIEFWEE